MKDHTFLKKLWTLMGKKEYTGTASVRGVGLGPQNWPRRFACNGVAR